MCVATRPPATGTGFRATQSPTHDSGPVWDATPLTVMDFHLQTPAGLPAHRGSISHPTQSLCTLRGRRRRRAHATLATGRVLPLTRAGLSPAGSDQLLLSHPPKLEQSPKPTRLQSSACWTENR